MKGFMKKAISFSIAIMLIALMLPSYATKTGGDTAQGNFIKITTAECFNLGELENVTVDAELGDGAITLTSGQNDGVWTSENLDVPAFEYLVASWMADTPQGTWVEVECRAYVDMYDKWSDWLSWGKWSPHIKRASTDESDSLAKIDTDIFTIKGSSGEASSKIQLRVKLHSDDGEISPVVRQIAGTMKNTLPDQSIDVWQEYSADLPEKVILDSPSYCQMSRDPAIGAVICSPTTLAMLLGHKGVEVFPEEVALNEYDFNYEGFGNWAFTTAAGGMYGFDTYCHYADFEFMRQQIAAGYPVGISVKYSSSSGSSYPYLENGAAGSTGGHLISIVGYELIDGMYHYYSNDSASNNDESCALRLYREDQLDKAWSGRLAYIMGDKEEGAGFAAPQRVEAQLEPVATAEGEYTLMVDGVAIDMPMAFNSAKTRTLGCGSMFYIREDSGYQTMPEGITARLANANMSYKGASITRDGTIKLTPELILGDLKNGEQVELTLWVITNNGTTYSAPVTLTAPVVEEEPPVLEEADTAEPDVPVVAPVTEPAQVDEGISITTVAIISAGALLIIAVTMLVIKRKK